MQERLIELIACPACRGALELSGAEPGEDGGIGSGTLACEGCGASYPVRGGVPRLLPASDAAIQERTGEHFALEFTALAEGDRDLDSPEVLEYFFFSRTGVDSGIYDRVPGDPYRTELPAGVDPPDGSFLHGKTVLEGGCGPGRLMTAAANHSEYAVGLEYGDHVDRAAARHVNIPNADFVQGSVLAPPFSPGVFDFVFSAGVLHHTPDPRGGALALAELVKPDGAMSLWVYGPEYWGNAARRVVGQAIHRRLSRMKPERAIRHCQGWLYRLGRVQGALARNRATKLLGAPLFVVSVPRHPRREVMVAGTYDYFCPPIITTHDYDEVRGWLEDGGFTRLRSVPVPTAWFAER